MSWSAGVSAKAPDELFEALDEVFGGNYPEPGTGVSAQFEAAKEAVDGLLMVVEADKYNCSLSGHSLADAPGTSPDSINISLNAAVTPS